MLCELSSNDRTGVSAAQFCLTSSVGGGRIKNLPAWLVERRLGRKTRLRVDSRARVRCLGFGRTSGLVGSQPRCLVAWAVAAGRSRLRGTSRVVACCWDRNVRSRGHVRAPDSKRDGACSPERTLAA